MIFGNFDFPAIAQLYTIRNTRIELFDGDDSAATANVCAGDNAHGVGLSRNATTSSAWRFIERVVKLSAIDELGRITQQFSGIDPQTCEARRMSSAATRKRRSFNIRSDND